MKLSEKIINERYNENIFINNPKYESDIKIIKNINVNDCEELVFSIIVPVYNQGDIIVKNITSVLEKTTQKNYELIIIIDCCSDNTEINICNLFKNIDLKLYDLLCNVLILKSVVPLFETAADNLGFFCSRGKYCLEIQADMEMTDYGYNMKLLKPFLLNNNIIGISGRCCHDFVCSKGIGKLGTDLTKKLKELPHIDINAYYIGETCNRGPLLLDKNKLKEMKFLDEVNYFLDNSDHDLFARSYVERSWICGYVPIDFNSPLENGSTRKSRDNLNKTYYQKKIYETQNGINGFFINNINKIPYRDLVKISY